MHIILKFEDDLIDELDKKALKGDIDNKTSHTINISGLLILFLSLSFIEISIIIALFLFIFLS